MKPMILYAFNTLKDQLHRSRFGSGKHGRTHVRRSRSRFARYMCIGSSMSVGVGRVRAAIMVAILHRRCARDNVYIGSGPPPRPRDPTNARLFSRNQILVI